jgi:5-methylthioribose kinase
LLQYGAISYQEMTESRLSSYLANLPEIAVRLGGHQALWQIGEGAFGELAVVFLAEGPSGAVCVKQALPVMVELDEPVRLPLERMSVEEAALGLQRRFAAPFVPRVLHFDSALALIVLERLHPHTTLRQGLIKDRIYPRFVEQITKYLARTLFATSDLAMPSGEKRERLAYFCTHAELCRMTEHLAFTEPYTSAGANRWTSPQLDGLAGAIRADQPLKRAVSALKLKFMAEPQALIHGGLTTDAVMVTETDTKVIDPTHASFGPIGFDVGTLLGHLLIAYYAQAGLAPPHAPRTKLERWLLGTVVQLWQGFYDEFLGLWRSAHRGDAYPRALFEGPAGAESLRQAQVDYMRWIFEDALRIAGVTIIRHTLGRDHVADFGQIREPERRAPCERHAIMLARELIKDAHHVSDMGQVVDVARQIREGAMDAG